MIRIFHIFKEIDDMKKEIEELKDRINALQEIEKENSKEPQNWYDR